MSAKCHDYDEKMRDYARYCAHEMSKVSLLCPHVERLSMPISDILTALCGTQGRLIK
jgi:hypothetical protein